MSSDFHLRIKDIAQQLKAHTALTEDLNVVSEDPLWVADNCLLAILQLRLSSGMNLGLVKLAVKAD